MATRRSHVVRVYDTSGGSEDKDTYIDVEVLDAISFKIARGEEVILKCPAKDANPHIVDDTGNGLEKAPGAQATRRTHVEHIKGSDGSELLIEVLDAISFKDKRGEEWILKMPSKASSHYNVTKGTGGTSATMRTHNEKIGADPKDKDPKDGYLTVERSDMISFKSVRGKEMILKMPSRDDGKDPGRADTHLWSPENYDPTSDDADPPKNEDPHFYVKFIKGKSALTGDELISQGPLWWIRKVTGGKWLVLVIKAQRVDNKQDYKLDGYQNFEAGGHNPDEGAQPVDLEKFPFDSSKGAGYKPSQVDDDHKKWRGNANTDDLDNFTALYFRNLDKETSVEIPIEFPKIGKINTSTNIGYYVWPSDNNDPTHPYLPQPDKEQAMGPVTDPTWVARYGPSVLPWIAYYNAGNSWYESWRPGLRAQLGGLIGYAAFDALVPPDGQNYGWTKKEDRDAFLAAFNVLTAWSQSQPGAYHDFWPLPTYYSFEIDWSVSTGPPKHPTATYDINAYQINGRNNMVFDLGNNLDFKVPTEQGKLYRQKTVSIDENSSRQKAVVKWTKEDGVEPITVEDLPDSAPL